MTLWHSTLDRKKISGALGFSSALVPWCLSVFFLSSCTYSEFNLATQKEETLIYNTEKEEKIGASVAAQMEKEFTMVSDQEQDQRLDRILGRIVGVCDRKELVYTIRVIDKDEMNAVSLPGGYVYMFKGLMDKLKTDDELAAVIAHEVGHITARHSMKRLQAAHGYTILQVLTIAANEPQAAYGVAVAFENVFLAYSRQDEFQADKLSVKYLALAGYQPEAVLTVLKKLQEEQRKRAPSRIAYFRTHPYVQERLGVVKKEITGQLDFEGYLNLTGQEKDLY